MKKLDDAIKAFALLAVVSFFLMRAAFWPCVCSAVVLYIVQEAVPDIIVAMERVRRE